MHTYEKDRQLAKEAGRKGGLSKVKDKHWQKLGRSITGTGSTNIQAYMNRLWKEGREEEYFEAYLKLLQYFKPKVMAHAVKTQTEVIFRFDPGDRELFEDI